MSSGGTNHIETRILSRAEINEQEWNAFIAQSPQGVNYALSWYLDVVWKGWQGIHIFYKGELHAVMPVRISRKWGLQYCFQPAFSQYGGIFFKTQDGKAEKILALKKRLVAAVVDAIPGKLARFVVNFAPQFNYPLPFYWAGYELHTRYSYWLKNDSNKQALFRNCNERTRTYIQKARKSGLLVRETTDITAIIQLSRKHLQYTYDPGLLRDLWQALHGNGAGTAIEIRDGQDRLHAGLIWQQSGDRQIHLFSATDPACRSLGGMSLAIWHSLETAGEDISFHDFEGSMLEPVEKFFRGFGTFPVAYLQVRKDRLPRIWGK